MCHRLLRRSFRLELAVLASAAIERAPAALHGGLERANPHAMLGFGAGLCQSKNQDHYDHVKLGQGAKCSSRGVRATPHRKPTRVHCTLCAEKDISHPQVPQGTETEDCGRPRCQRWTCGGGGLNRVYLEAGTRVFKLLDRLSRRYAAVTLGVRWMTSPGNEPSA